VYASVKQELETLRRDDIKHEEVSPATRSYHPGSSDWEDFHMETLSLLPFNVSAFCYDQQEEGWKGVKAEAKELNGLPYPEHHAENLARMADSI
jgi:hypothetical protein